MTRAAAANDSVSVLMPIKNGASYARQAIDSILHQKRVNLQLIIFDDQSNPATKHLLEVFRRSDRRVLLLSCDKGEGIVHGLNHMLERAEGTYVARMDADDFALPNRLATQLHHARQEQHPGVLFGGAEYMDHRGTGIGFHHCPADDFAFHLAFRNPFVHPTLFAELATLREYGYREIPYAEDYDLYCRMIMDGIRLSYSPTVVLRYRIHPHQLRSGISKAYYQNISTLWIQQQYRKGTISDADPDMTQLLSLFPVGPFRHSWPKYVDSITSTGPTWYRTLLSLGNYYRHDSLTKEIIRNSISYRLALLKRNRLGCYFRN